MTDTELLDWLERELRDPECSTANFSCGRPVRGRNIGRVGLFTVSSQHVAGDTIRDAIQEAVRHAAVEQQRSVK